MKINFIDPMFFSIYKRFQKPVIRFLTRKVGDAEIATELAQEVFLKLYRFGGSVLFESAALPGFIFKVAANTALDWLRGTGTERRSVRALELDEDPAAPESAGWVESAEKRGIFRKCLKVLTRPQRRVVWLRLIHGLSFEEIAARLSLTPGAAKCLLHRAKAVWLEAGLVTA